MSRLYLIVFSSLIFAFFPILAAAQDSNEPVSHDQNSQVVDLQVQGAQNTATGEQLSEQQNQPDQEQTYASQELDRINLDDKDDLLQETAKKDDENQKRNLLHNFQLGLSFVHLPGFILDAWFEHHGNTMDGYANLGVSLDYFLRFVDLLELRFSLSWADLKTKDAFWLQSSRKNEPQLADFIKQNLSVVALEAAVYGYVDIIPEISFYYGGGLWGGVLLGKAKAYPIRSSCVDEVKLNGGSIQNCAHEPGSAPILGIPPVVGFLSATIGFKFTLMEILTLRAEGGFKGYFYGQVGIGAQF